MSVDFDAERSAYLRRLAAAHAPGEDRLGRLAALYDDAVAWHGSHPLNERVGAPGVVEALWRPLLAAVPDLERRDDVLLAGAWRDAPWVAACGHYVGTFARDWLDVPATGVPVSIRYGEITRLDGGRIVEAYVFLDLLDVMRQAGVWPLAPPLGSAERWPGPRTHDGVIAAPRDAAESAESLRLVEAMIAGLMEFDGRTLESMGQQRFWDVERMMWCGPAGIGTCRGLRGFQDVHQRPFLAAFPDRLGGDHRCRIGEGAYVASTGWPSIRATHAGGGFLGLPPTGRAITMRVMDFWRRDAGRLAENWVFIDLPHLLLQMGYDVLARAAARGPRGDAAA